MAADARRLNEKINDIENARKEADRENLQLKKDLSRNQRQHADNNKNNDALQRKVEKLQDSCDRLAEELADAQQQLKKLASIKSTLEGELQEQKDALHAKDAVLQQAQADGEEARRLKQQLQSAGRKQRAFTGQQMIDDSVELTGKAVDSLMECFLMPSRAQDMAVEVERKKAEAKRGDPYAPRTP